jgi:putative radical SAM enzyme (TIGR03279 family)
MRFSPIRVSIHTTNPELRVQMMKNKRSGEVLSYLDDFVGAGLSVCGQIVLCKGINDGDELLRTMRDLEKYFPSLGSVSIVPAGLTKHRDGLYPLSDFTKEEAGAVIDLIDSVAEKYLEKNGSRLFFAADELYLKAGRELPPDEYYEDYSQIENGVGMLRSIITEFDIALQDVEDYSERLTKPRRVAIATGYASYDTMVRFAELIKSKTDKIQIDVYPIKNIFFGESITVSGLLTGRDICDQLAGRLDHDELLLPSAALRHPEMDFLCGMTLEEVGKKLGVKIRVTESDGFDLLDAVFGE